MRNYILSEKETLSNQPIYTVADLSNAVKRAIESNFDFVRVRGEISKPASPGSGHIYFSLKDQNVTLACVIWKGQLSHINIQPEEGMDVICSGKLTTFSGQSRYQLNVIQIEYSGEGALLKQLEVLKIKTISSYGKLKTKIISAVKCTLKGLFFLSKQLIILEFISFGYF